MILEAMGGLKFFKIFKISVGAQLNFNGVEVPFKTFKIFEMFKIFFGGPN